MALRESFKRVSAVAGSFPAEWLASLRGQTAAFAAPPTDKGISDKIQLREEWKAIKIPEEVAKKIPTTVGGIAFPDDIRSTSGLGLGDGIKSHTAKWLQTGEGITGTTTSPMEFIAQQPPKKVHGLVYASYGSDDPALGCPVEYINLKGTTLEEPAVCKYTGNRFYSDDWKGGGHH